MTLVVCWRMEENLTVAADTRLSAPGPTSGRKSLTDQGPKIFTTPIFVSQPKGKQLKVRSHPPVGFAYSGETLIAQSVHAMASICLQNLCGDVVKRGPSLEDIAELYRKCATTYLKEMASLQGNYPNFQAIVFGYCSHVKDYRAHVLQPADDDPLDMRQRGYDVPTGFVLHIGSGVREFVQIMDTYAAAGRPIDTFTAFELVLRTNANQSVGGSRQYADASSQGVFLRPAMVSIPDEQGSSRIEVLGYDVETLGNVGDYPVGHSVLGTLPDNSFL